jgi:thioredoxin reductase/SAM-dependent methyltransferase
VDENYDVIVVGGGAAGLSGALALARARRSVLVIDAGEPRNAPAGHLHNYLGRDGMPPAELLATGRAEVAGYGGVVRTGRAVTARRDGGPDGDGAPDGGSGFTVTLADGTSVRGRRLLVTTGLTDVLPDVPGIAQRWGRDVLHCPYCHGWEVRDRRVGILATGPLSIHQAEMWRQWSPHVVVLRHDLPPLDIETAERFAAREVSIVEGKVTGLVVEADRLTGVRLATGELIELDALVVAPTLVTNGGVLAELGVTPVDTDFGPEIPADPAGATAVPGVWVAGNVANPRAQLITSAAAGLTAAAAINTDLIAEDTRAAVAAYRQRVGEAFSTQAWEERYRSRPSVWSGQPNRQLVDEAAGLVPGRALDVGCGEGADAVWLAERGWRVTAVDLSATALERAAAHAAAAGAEVAARVTWVEADLRAEPPEAASYDLVTAHFMHLPGAARAELFARLAAAVTPGGTLLIVGHHPADLRTSAHRMHFPELMYTADDVAAGLDPADWDVVAADARPRSTVDPDGRDITIHDAVLVARRR